MNKERKKLTPKKMAKQSSMLQKRLLELEHELKNKVFSLPAKTQLPELYTQEVEQRFIFLKNLLLAETASSSKRQQYRLQQTGKRLSDLVTAFYDWNSNNKPVTTQDQLENVSCNESCLDDDGNQTYDENGSGECEEAENAFQSLIEEKTPLTVTTQDQLENVSCTESCLDDDGDQTSDETGPCEFEEAENVVLVQTLTEKIPLMETEMVKVLGKKRSGRFFWGMASGVVIGMALMGLMTVSSSGCLPYLKHSVYLPPT